MADDVDILLTAVDKASGEIKKVTVSSKELDASIASLVEQEKKLIVGENATDIFKGLTEAEKQLYIEQNRLNQAMGDGSKAGGSFKTTLTEINSGIALVEKGLQYAQKAYDMTAGAAMAYAETVRDLSSISGQSAEDTSRFIQVLDDYQLTAQDATTATKALTKNGLTPNLDTLAKLSDEYRSINDIEEKNAFILKNLGKGGLEWARVLDQGSEALRKQAAEVNKGLILSQKQLDNAEKLRLAQDQLNDSTEALKVSIGNELVPVLLDVATAVNTNIEKDDEWYDILRNTPVGGAVLGLIDLKNAHDANSIAAVETAQALQIEKMSVEELAAQQKELEAALKATTEANNGMLSLTMKIQGENDKYAEGLDNLNAKGVELQEELNTLVAQGWQPYSEKVQDATQKINDNAQAITDLQTKHQEAMARIAYDLLVAKLQADGFTDAEYKIAIQAGVTAGVLDETTAQMALDMNNVANAAIEAASYVETFGNTILNLPDGKTITIRTQYATIGSTAGPNAIPQKAAGGIVEVESAIPQKAAGGLTWVGETGPELVNLPGGSNVASSPQSKAIMDNAPLLAALEANKIDYSRMARAIRDAIQAGG